MRRWVPVAALLSLGAWSCGKPSADTARAAAPAAEPTRLVITGSSTIAPLAAELGERFEATHPGLQVDVQTGGSSRGVADARSGTAAIGMVSRALKPEEQDLTASTIARDGIGIIVHKDSPVTTLTSSQVVAIYKGETSSWGALVAGDTKPIFVVHKAEGRSTGELFREHFKLKPSEVKPSVIIGDNEQGIKTVAGNPAAIGYVSIGSAERSIAQGVPIKFVPVDGVVPTRAAVKAGTFPISRPLQFVTRGPPQGVAGEFIQFARSPGAYELVEKHAFVPAAP